LAGMCSAHCKLVGVSVDGHMPDPDEDVASIIRAHSLAWLRSGTRINIVHEIRS